MGRPVVYSQQADKFVVENDETNCYTEAESELSLGSRSFVHRVNDQVRKNYSDNWHSIKNTEDLTMKQMFDISEKLLI